MQKSQGTSADKLPWEPGDVSDELILLEKAPNVLMISTVSLYLINKMLNIQRRFSDQQGKYNGH